MFEAKQVTQDTKKLSAILYCGVELIDESMQ